MALGFYEMEKLECMSVENNGLLHRSVTIGI
jgi:hypothetical protein